MATKGFTLIELLVALSVFMIVVLFPLGTVREMIEVSSSLNERTETMAKLGELLFQIQSGERDDLFFEGGKQKGGEFSWSVESTESLLLYRRIRLAGFTQRPRNAFDLEVFLRGKGKSKIQNDKGKEWVHAD